MLLIFWKAYHREHSYYYNQGLLLQEIGALKSEVEEFKYLYKRECQKNQKMVQQSKILQVQFGLSLDPDNSTNVDN
jgi:hypothetical protein